MTNEVLDVEGLISGRETRKERKKRLAGEYRRRAEELKEFERAEAVDVPLPRRSFPSKGERVPENFVGPSYLKVSFHRASTRVFAAAYPFMAQGSLGHEGVYMGQDKTGGGAFCVDPWKWYDKKFVDGTSMVLLGAVGTGKSTCGKTMVSRLVQLGKKAAVCSDLKGEWVQVSRYVGGGVISVGPGKGTCINPLDEGSRPSQTKSGDVVTDGAWAAIVRARRLALLKTIVSLLLGSGSEVRPEEDTALTFALDLAVADAAYRGHTVTIGHVVQLLKNPGQEAYAEVGDAGRRLYHALRRMLTGDLAGMFDGESTESFDATLPMMVIDTSALKSASAEARKITNACTAAWVEAAVTNPDNGQRILIYEEGWDSMSDPYSLARMVEQWKLARDYGICNLLIMHKVADTDMAGDAGSQTQAMARSLLTDAEIAIIYRQKPDALDATEKAFGLTDTERNEVRKLPKGHGLWKVGDKSFIVQNIMTEAEAPVFNTDSRMGKAS